MMRYLLSSLTLLTACNLEPDVADPVRAPVATILSPSPDSELPSGAATFIGQASDLDSAPERLFATWSLAPVVGEGTWRDVCQGFVGEDGLVLCVTELEPTDARLRFFVVDAAGYLDIDYRDLVVREVQPPGVTLLAPETTKAYAENLPVRLAAALDDPDHDPDELTVTWEAEGLGRLDGPTVPDANGILEGRAWLPEGQQRVTLVVTDPDGARTLVGVEVYVGPPDEAPTVRVRAPRDGAIVAADAPLALDATALDDVTDDGALIVAWSDAELGGLGVAAGDELGSYRLMLDDGLAPGTHTLTVTATDEADQSTAASVTITADPAPTLTVACPDDGATVPTGGLLPFAFFALDGGTMADDLDVVVTSDLAGELGVYTPSSVDGSGVTRYRLSDGVHALTTTVTDPLGQVASDVRSVTVGGSGSAPACPQVDTALP